MLKFILSIFMYAVFTVVAILVLIFTVGWIIDLAGLWSIVILCGLLFMVLGAALYNDINRPTSDLDPKRVKEQMRKYKDLRP